MRSDIKNMAFASRLREVMEKQGLNQVRLAELVGVAQSRISEWKAGKSLPQRRVGEALADKLGVTVDWLVDGVGPKTGEEKSVFILRTAASIANRVKAEGLDSRSADKVFDHSEAVLREEPPGYGGEWRERALVAERRAALAEGKLANLRVKVGELMKEL